MVVTKEDVKGIVKLLLINNQKALHGYVIASLYFQIGEFRAALKYVSKYLKVKPRSFIAYKLQGECYQKLNKFDDALKSYRMALIFFEKKRKLKSPSVNSRANKIKEMDVEEMHTAPEEAYFNTHTNDESCPETTFKFPVSHISSLDCPVCSKIFFFENLSWRIVVTPKRNLGPNRNFSVYLICNGGYDSSLWSCNVNVEFRLLSVKPNQYHYVQKVRHLFNKEDDVWGFPEFISWNDIVSPDSCYMQDDCITVEVHLEVMN